MMHLPGPGPKGNRTPMPLLNAGKFSRVAHLFCRGGVKVLCVCSCLPGWVFPPSRAFRTPSLTKSPALADLLPLLLKTLTSSYPISILLFSRPGSVRGYSYARLPRFSNSSVICEVDFKCPNSAFSLSLK